MEVYSTADLVSIISQEMLIDVTIVFMESTKIKNMTIACMANDDTLSSVSFLHCNSHKSKNLASWDVKDCIEDLSYIK